jgi:hypothetical protein
MNETTVTLEMAVVYNECQITEVCICLSSKVYKSAWQVQQRDEFPEGVRRQ